MKKEEIVNKFLEKALRYIESTEVFIKDNIPSYITELLEFKVWESLISIGFSMIPISITLVLSFILIRKGSVFLKENPGDESGVCMIGVGCIIWLILIPFGHSMYKELITIVKIETAPRVYIIDYLKK